MSENFYFTFLVYVNDTKFALYSTTTYATVKTPNIVSGFHKEGVLLREDYS